MLSLQAWALIALPLPFIMNNLSFRHIGGLLCIFTKLHFTLHPPTNIRVLSTSSDRNTHGRVTSILLFTIVLGLIEDA